VELYLRVAWLLGPGGSSAVLFPVVAKCSSLFT